jgi:hypothetical protein
MDNVHQYYEKLALGRGLRKHLVCVCVYNGIGRNPCTYVAKHMNNYLTFLDSGCQELQTLILRKEALRSIVLRNLSTPNKDEGS